MLQTTLFFLLPPKTRQSVMGPNSAACTLCSDAAGYTKVGALRDVWDAGEAIVRSERATFGQSRKKAHKNLEANYDR